MPSAHFERAGLLALIISFSLLAAWELYLRHRFYQAYSGFSASYDDNDALWAHTRDRVYEPTDQTTVFIGSFRMRFDIDVPSWENLSKSGYRQDKSQRRPGDIYPNAVQRDLQGT